MLNDRATVSIWHERLLDRVGVRVARSTGSSQLDVGSRHFAKFGLNDHSISLPTKARSKGSRPRPLSRSRRASMRAAQTLGYINGI